MFILSPAYNLDGLGSRESCQASAEMCGKGEMPGRRVIRRVRRDANGGEMLQSCARRHGRVMRQVHERLEHDRLDEMVRAERFRELVG